ncbi:unnamed protein product [Musa textilis]
MERSRNSQKLQYDLAETRNDGFDPANQTLKQAPLSTSHTNSRSAEFVASDSARHALNYSFQTGEEFSIEFMRDKVIPKRPYIPNPSRHQITSSNYVDLRRRRAISNAEPGSGSDVPGLASENKAPSEKIEKKGFVETNNKSYLALTRTQSHAPAGNSSYRAFHPQYASSDPSPTRVKFLCSYGGKFLPRPSDGKLRYVGGATHILRINKSMSWEELMQRARRMYNQTSVIKYQLPGEDLDALISVHCNDDLQHMIDECTVLEDSEASQRPRMFLFSSDDSDIMHFTLGTMEGDSAAQYVAAINGLEASVDASSLQGLQSMSAGDLDQSISASVELGVNPRLTASETTGTYVSPEAGRSRTTTTSLSSPMQANLSGDIKNHPEFKDYNKRHNAEGPYSAIHHHDTYQSDGNGIPTSASTSETYAKPLNKLLNAHWSGTADFSVGISSQDQNVENREAKPIVKGLSQQIDAAKENQSGHRFSSPVQQHGVSLSCVQLETPCGTSASVFETSSRHRMKILETQVSLSLDTSVSAGKSSMPQEHVQPYTSAGEVTTKCSDYKPKITALVSEDSHPRVSRVSFKDQMPINQEELLIKLSNFSDQIGSHKSELDQFSHKKQQLVGLLVPVPVEDLSSESDILSIAANPLRSNPTSTQNDVKEIERRETSVSVIQRNQVGIVSIAQTPGNSSCPHDPMIGNKPLTEHSACNHEEAVVPSSSHLASDQTINARNRTSELHRKVEKLERDYTPSSVADEKNTLKKYRTWNESDMSTSQESSTFDGKTFMPDICFQDPLVEGSEATKPNSSSSSIGSIMKQKENPTLLSSKLCKEEITTTVRKLDTARKHADTHLDRDAGIVSQGNSSLPTMEHNNPLNYTNSQFLPDLVTNSFSKVKTSEEPSTSTTSSKHNVIIGSDMPSGESQYSLLNLFNDEFSSKDVTVMNQKQVHEEHFLTEIGGSHSGQLHFAPLENEVMFGQKNPQIDFDEVDSSLANVGENLRTALLEYEECVSDKKEVNEPGTDVSMEVPHLRNVQIIKDEDLEELRELGSGTYGTVYHGKWRGTDVAIKRIKNSYFTGQSSQTDKTILGFWREVGILSKLHHPNVVAFYGIVKYEPGGTLATVTEFMPHGSLKHVLRRKDKYLDFRKRLLIAMDAAIGMEYLHSKNIVHFDLKCDNLLVNLKDQSRPICKVCDFGLSKMKLHTMVSGGVRGTLPWMAPELLYTNSNKVSEKIDVYSFGIVMWEILTGEEPYADMHYGEVIGGLLHNTLRPPVPVSCNKEWRNLMEQCWAADPEQRPTFTQIASCLYSMYKASQTRATS